MRSCRLKNLWMLAPCLALAIPAWGQSPIAPERPVPVPADTARLEERAARAIEDSIQTANESAFELVRQGGGLHVQMAPQDSIPPQAAVVRRWIPNPTRATWYALIFPGGGQIYNKKYWKLPIFYGGFAGCAYALTWNSRMYSDYSAAYKDAVLNKWDAKSITDLIPKSYIQRTSKDQITKLLKNRKDLYGRFRDLSIFAFIGVYLLSVADAYIDAELSDFDLSPDLSMHIEPVLIGTQAGAQATRGKDFGVSCSLKF